MDATDHQQHHEIHHADPHHHPDGHRGWVRPNGRRGRWLEPFLLRLVAEGETHGSLLIDRLDALCLAPDGVDVGMAYRTLREFEAEGLLRSTWITGDGPPRRSYQLTSEGWAALDEWIAVMRERSRLIEAFLDGTERLDRRAEATSQGG
jgi:PadR family transcriptional regulator PadR